jgi:uncharacterized protein
LFAFVLTGSALAYTPPPNTAHVTDTAHKLSESERITIDRKLEDYRLRTTNEIAVFIPASLEGATPEEVAFAAGRTWKIGVKGKDNGIVLMIAPVERKAHIAVGKGAEGSLTDLQSVDIIHDKVRPHLTPGREDYRAAVDDATDAIMAALDKASPGGGTIPKSAAPAPSAGSAALAIVFLLLIFLVPIIILIVLIRLIAGAFTSNNGGGYSGWSSGGGGWSDGGGGGGGGGDSGFSGGGGDFGGGGGGDSF